MSLTDSSDFPRCISRSVMAKVQPALSLSLSLSLCYGATITLSCSALEAFPCSVCAQVPSARWPPSALPIDAVLMGTEEGRSLAKHKAKEEEEGTWQKPQPLLWLCQKQTENGSHNQGGQEMELAGNGSVANHSNLQAAQPRRACLCTGCVALHPRSVAVLFSWDND